MIIKLPISPITQLPNYLITQNYLNQPNKFYLELEKLYLTIFIISIFLLYLIIESIRLNRWRNSIPLRIAVTGTRGKSSVVRLLASILREDGRKVLAKTTGSEAKYILPDGSETEVFRRGIPSIIEQKKLLRKAALLEVDCIVAEIMSIHPENHYVESQKILKPNLVAITNIRQDHIDAMGKTKDEIAAVFCHDIPEKSKIFIHEHENSFVFQNAVKKAKGELIVAGKESSSFWMNSSNQKSPIEFSENYDLVFKIADYLNINEQAISNGIRKAKYDIGQPKIWTYKTEEINKTIYFVNGFAANDPDSTFQMISKIKPLLPRIENQFVGLLCLRTDRGDRTVQWIEALNNGAANFFEKVFVQGVHARIVKRKIKWIDLLGSSSPPKMINTIVSQIEDQTVIFGFGNIGGIGKKMIEYWNKIGEPYGV